jgi:hypothetical protein
MTEIEQSSEDRRVTLRGSGSGNAHWVEIKPDGWLVVEWYDHSQAAQDFFDHDAAYLLRINPDDKRRMLHILAADAGRAIEVEDPDGLLLELADERFATYFEIKAWLDGAGIPFKYEYDGMA